jgi:hypothetical protein
MIVRRIVPDCSFLGPHRLTFDTVLETHATTHLSNNRNGVRVPGTQHVVWFDLLVFCYRQHRTVRYSLLFHFATTIVHDADLTVSSQNNLTAFRVDNAANTSKSNLTRSFRKQFAGFDVLGRHTTDVERTHRQLSTRLTDTLCGDDPDGHTHFNEIAHRKVHTVTQLAKTQSALASHRAANLNSLEPHFFDLTSLLDGDQVVLRERSALR